MNRQIYNLYLRKNRLPHVWCPGCGIGIAFASLLRALNNMGLKKEDVVLVSGIGCSGRISGYFDSNTLHTTHGRPLAFATGIKLVNPKLTVIVAAGDGDTFAIGGNHFIHAARRNVDITLILFNNWTYGMTGGQVSPTTPEGSKLTTSPYGSIEPRFDPVSLAIGAGATFVARGTSFHVHELDKLIELAIKHNGFSIVEVMSPCPVDYGRRNAMDTLDLYAWLKENVIPRATWERLPEEEKKRKLPRGVLYVNKERPPYCEKFVKLLELVKHE